MVLARGRKFSALPRTERQNPAGRSDPPDGVLLWRCYLSTDESRSVYPTAQIRQGGSRKRPDRRERDRRPGLATTHVAGRVMANSPTQWLAAGRIGTTDGREVVTCHS